ncbi:MAG: 3'(2'),5'-bisphosphate nucleotidase CysQ [Sphingobacteriia bacterium]|nr:3'(2'),5'-bisphosphate nucleotidase CysQ [Sphingobacteriia bacterium]
MNNQLLEEAIKICLAAGEILKNFYGEDFIVYIKEDDSPVTIADRETNDFIVSELHKISDIPIISEEKYDDFDKSNHTFWLLDPLDGTKQFIKNEPEFCISLALIENNQPIMGIIYAPITNELYYAEKGKGVKSNIDINSPSEKIHAITNKNNLNEIEKKIFNLINAEEITKVKSAIKYGRIAINKHNFYIRFNDSCIWDIAAGHAILKEAGFEIIDLITHEPLIYDPNNLINNPFVVIPRTLEKDLNKIYKLLEEV